MKNSSEIIKPEQALEMLKQGNNHYLNSKNNNADISKERREHIAENGQNPYAVIVTCSDSRVVPEHIFSAGIGDLFIIRTAGNVVANIERGSIEYAVTELGAKLIVVMGHSKCGAVSAAMNSESGDIGGYIAVLINEIKPAITNAANITEAERLNITNTRSEIMKSEIVSALVKSEEVVLIEAKYDIETGKAEFFN